MPVNQIKGFVSHLQKNFRGRMFRMFIVNSPLLLTAFWNIAWTWLDDFIKQKITICGYNNVGTTLMEYIDENTLE